MKFGERKKYSKNVKSFFLSYDYPHEKKEFFAVFHRNDKLTGDEL